MGKHVMRLGRRVVYFYILRILQTIQEKLGIVISGYELISSTGLHKVVRIFSQGKTFFLKISDQNSPADFFSAEARSLEVLSKYASCHVPKVVGVGKDFLLLEYIDEGIATSDYWSDLGAHIAELHGVSSPTFGLDFDNYIGRLPQENALHNSWKEFFALQRVLPQVKLARDKNLLTQTDVQNAERICQELDNYLPVENPSLIHGDLWSGNVMAGTFSNPVIFDPAIYFGHREMDIAMTKLFGGFPLSFYEGYNRVFPLEKGWENRVDIYNIYPLLVHVNLFGLGYVGQLRSILSGL